MKKRKKLTFPQARDHAKRLGYKFTQEGESIHIEIPGKMSTTFPLKEQFALWMHYHLIFDVE